MLDSTLTLYRFVQPWAGDKRLKRTRYGNMIVYGFIVIGLCICGYLTYDGAKAAKNGDVGLSLFLLRQTH